MARRVMFGVIAIAVAAFAAAAIAGSASADGTLDDTAFEWTLEDSNPNVEFTFGAGGAGPTGWMPTAEYTGAGKNKNVTYKVIGDSVTLSSETIAHEGGSRTSYYYDFGNGVYFNKAPHHGLLSTDSTAVETAETTYTLRAISFHGKYSDLTFTITVNPALSITQTTTRVSMRIGNPTTHTLDAASGGSGTYTYSVHQGILPPPSPYILESDWTITADLFETYAPIEYDAATRVIQLNDKLRDDLDYTADSTDVPREVGDYPFTIRVEDSWGQRVWTTVTVEVQPALLGYTSVQSKVIGVEAGQSVSEVVATPVGGVLPFTVTTSPFLSDDLSFDASTLTLSITTERTDDNDYAWYVIFIYTTDSSPTPQSTMYPLYVHVVDR